MERYFSKVKPTSNLFFSWLEICLNQIWFCDPLTLYRYCSFFLTLSRLWFFLWSCMDVRVGLWQKLSTEELMLLNCGVEKALESPLDCKEIQPVHSERDQPWDFFGRNDAKVETPVLWPPHAKSWLIGKDSDAGRDWGQAETGPVQGSPCTLCLAQGWHRTGSWHMMLSQPLIANLYSVACCSPPGKAKAGFDSPCPSSSSQRCPANKTVFKGLVYIIPQEINSFPKPWCAVLNVVSRLFKATWTHVAWRVISLGKPEMSLS